MEQRVSIVTLGVADLARARAFYEAIGWVGQEVEQTVFFQAGGLVVVLWAHERLAPDAGLDPHDVPHGAYRGVVLAHNVRERADVAAILDRARGAGARVTVPARDTFYGGWAGTFVDPDGHAWEVAWNPGLPLAADGSLVLPDLGG